jgi:hypothetical protein
MMYHFDGVGAQKVITFLNNISQAKNSVWCLNWAFFLTVCGLKREAKSRQNTPL